MQFIDPGEFERAREQIDDQLDQLSVMRGELRELQTRAQSAAGHVSCTVDGEGRVLDIQIARGSLGSEQPKALADEIVNAITSARQQQGQATGERYRRMFARLSGSEYFDVDAR